jgi:hypothetical protein
VGFDSLTFPLYEHHPLKARDMLYAALPAPFHFPNDIKKQTKNMNLKKFSANITGQRLKGQRPAVLASQFVCFAGNMFVFRRVLGLW